MSEAFDFQSVVELLMGDEEIAKELLNSYLLQTEEHMNLLQNLLHDVDIDNKREEVRRKAHLIKGSSLNVGAKDFANAMLEMEKGFNTLTNEELLQLYEIALNKFINLKKEIGKFQVT